MSTKTKTQTSNYLFEGSTSNSEFKSVIFNNITLRGAKIKAKKYLKAHMDGINNFSGNVYVIDLNNDNRIVAGFEFKSLGSYQNYFGSIDEFFFNLYKKENFLIDIELEDETEKCIF